LENRGLLVLVTLLVFLTHHEGSTTKVETTGGVVDATNTELRRGVGQHIGTDSAINLVVQGTAPYVESDNSVRR
jgi:hypothetical protein